uniref:Uncharacterized protein n=1 Tax=Anguilla anguilla TaxID=7936 RepID=A0A0E9XDZ4_ANGAN
MTIYQLSENHYGNHPNEDLYKRQIQKNTTGLNPSPDQVQHPLCLEGIQNRLMVFVNINLVQFKCSWLPIKREIMRSSWCTEVGRIKTQYNSASSIPVHTPYRIIQCHLDVPIKTMQYFQIPLAHIFRPITHVL